MELGSHSWMDCLAAELVLSSRFSNTVFVTLFRTAVGTAICEVYPLLRHSGPHRLNIVVLAVADGLFGLHGSERRYELFMPPSPATSSSCFNK